MTINVTTFSQQFNAMSYAERHTYHFEPGNNNLVHNSFVAANALIKDEKEGN